VRAHGRGDAEGDAAHGGEEESAARQDERGLEAAEDLVQHRALHPQRAPQIAADHVPHPAQVLDGQWLGQAELAAQPREVFLRRLGAEHDLRGITRREMQHHEDHDRHAEQHRHEQQEPPGEIAPQRRGLT